jgi:hypothetical protein
MDNFTAEKFGTDNAGCEQDSKMSVKQLEDLQEDTLVNQKATNEAVHEEEEGSELEDVEEYDDFGDQIKKYPDYEPDRDQESPHSGDDDSFGGGLSDEEAPWYRKPYEEQLDPRWFRDEYVLLNEAVDWDAIEKDPKQLFTVGNSKVGKDTIIFNLQPARFCPSLEQGHCKIVKPIDGQYKIACYAYQDERQYKVSLQLRQRQMRFWDTHTAEEIFKKLEDFYYLVHGDSMVYPVLMAKRDETAKRKGHPDIKGKEKSVKLKYIRFNQSGDLKDVDDAKKMDKVAELALKNLGLVTYTYTARKDILAEYKFQHVHVQGSGFAAITGINRPVKAKFGKRKGEYLGKVFAAFPSIYNKSGKLVEREPNKLYYEDIMYHSTPEGSRNPRFNKWSHSNEKGWYACRGDCNSCTACKADEVKHIAVKIHRSFQKISDKWQDVEETPTGGYKVHQKFDPYEREALTGQPLVWSKEMEDEYETTAKLLKKETEFNRLPKQEQVDFLTIKLLDLYDNYDPDLDKEELDKRKRNIDNWEKKAAKRDIDVAKLRAEAGMPAKKEKKKK